MKLWSISIQFINWISWQKVWNFQASYFSSEFFKLAGSVCETIEFFKPAIWALKLKLINSFHRLNQFARRLMFLNKHIQPWRFCIFPSCFIAEIGSRFFFLASYSSFKKMRLFKFTYILNWLTKILRSLSKLFEQGIYKLFQFIF